MPIRLLVLTLFASLLLIGCTTQRDSADMDDDMPPVGGPPPISTYVYGTWDYTMASLNSSDTMTGLLTISEEGPGRLTMSNGLDASIETQEVSVTAPNFILDGMVQTEEPFSLSLAGSVAGDHMEAEANLDGMGVYLLTATRVQE